MKKDDDFMKLISLSWDKAIISFNSNSYDFVEITCACRGKSFNLKTEEAGSLGRIELNGLAPETDYRLTGNCGKLKSKLEFKTLPVPVGKLLSSYAVIADPHVSEKKENRKGRLFVESAMILESVIEECNELGVDFSLIAGDLTNSATNWEYETVKKIMGDADAPVFSVPGDHDIAGNMQRRWRSFFGEDEWSTKIKEYHITGLNTGKNSLSGKAHKLLEEASETKKFPLVLTHSLLFHNPYIKYGAKCKPVENSPKSTKSLDGIRAVPSIIYAGHQNIPSRVAEGSSVQVSIPQISQYICGYYIVRHFKNGFYHFFMPIKSEALRQYSRSASGNSVDFYSEKQWTPSYREGESIYQSNFII